jgi:outer membrane protein OmpA-like peptidoglycan-associated protein
MLTRARTAVALAALLGAAGARAEDPAARGFDPDPVRPALSLDGGFTVETAEAPPRGAKGTSLRLDWSSGLLSLRLGDERDALLASRLSAHLLGGWSLGWIEIGAHLPVALWQRSDFTLLESRGVTSGPLVAPVASAALGDLRLGAKVPVLDPEDAPLGLGLAAFLDVRLPTGDEDAFTGEGAMAVPSVVATRWFGDLRLDGQLGYAIRGRGQYAQLVVHDGLVFGLGGTYELPRVALVRRWSALGELTGAWPRGNDLSTDRYRAPLSARAGVRAVLSPLVAVDLGAGTGLGSAGYGREGWRVFLGVRFPGELGAPAGSPQSEPWKTGEDRDRDGVADGDDLCPTVAGAPELDGCPDKDDDAIPDREDKCPDRAGPATSDGCPPAEEEPLVEIETERLSLKDAIQFDTGKDTIRRQSFPVLDEIAGILSAHREIAKIRVEGHTDDVGSATYNKDLSERRAQSVVRYLVAKGVDRGRLVAAGFGEERPIAPNKTALGRAKNRRVEFTILDEAGADRG